ncbi:MAG: efflux RND transporter periplasmic adaptor subunit [Pirellulales bacterium]|nr:efflux RND transporter periplasmic adaptor subunit [Pirellulales bacterium]
MNRLRALSRAFNRRTLIVLPIVAGAAIFWFMRGKREAPAPGPLQEIARTLRVIEVPQVALVPRVVGYGVAQAADRWSAVAQVKGRIVQVHPELKSGAILRAGEVVLQIDPTEYEIRIAQLQAEIAETKSQQARLQAEEENLRASLKIEQDSLALAKRDLARLQSLTAGSTITESEVEAKQREVLAQRQSVQNIDNSLNVLPAEVESLTATLAAKQASLKLAELDLDYTTIKAPFDCRVGELALEVGQFLAAGQSLLEAYGIDVTEVEAQFPMNQARTLLHPGDAPSKPKDINMEMIRKIFDVDVEIRMESGDFAVTWPGRFDRVREQLDVQTRTVRIVVAVDKPYENVIPGERPPLAPGMFCEVELRAKPRTGQIVIPRTAMRNGQVYVVNAENRLETRNIEVAFSQGGLTCVKSGLQPGERLVVSDPTPAVVGMLVEPTPDAQTEEILLAESAAEAPLQ